MSKIATTDQAATSPHLDTLPERTAITGLVLRSWRQAGYRISERRQAEWLYLLVRDAHESAVYKIVGPTFRGPIASYAGVRIA